MLNGTSKLERNPTWICVVALALADGQGHWLMHRRPPNKHHGGLWEFPGGKVENDENPGEALVREIAEETGLTLEPADLTPAVFAQEGDAGPRIPIVILLYTSLWNGCDPVAHEGGELAWFTPQQITELDKPPLDVELVDRLFQKLLD